MLIHCVQSRCWSSTCCQTRASSSTGHHHICVHPAQAPQGLRRLFSDSRRWPAPPAGWQWQHDSRPHNRGASRAAAAAAAPRGGASADDDPAPGRGSDAARGAAAARAAAAGAGAAQQRRLRQQQQPASPLPGPAPQQPYQQQQQRPLQAGTLRQQLQQLWREQQQLQQQLDQDAVDSAFGGRWRSSSSGGSSSSRGGSSSGRFADSGGELPGSARLRAAAAGSTDVLLSLLNSQVPQLTGQVPPLLRPAGSEGVGEGSITGGSSRQPQQQQQQQQHQPHPPHRRLPQHHGLPPHVPLLAEALTIIAAHCRRRQLLPHEAARLQRLLLRALLPALAPHAAAVGWKQLSRAVYALGLCLSSSWGEGDDGDDGDDGGDDAAAHGSAGGDVGDSQHGSASTAAAAAAAAAATSTRAWVRRLLPHLPPKRMSAGALLAAWQGCGLAGVLPPRAWLDSAAAAALRHLRAGRFDGKDSAGLLQACAALGYGPPAWLMAALVEHLQQHLGRLTPADLAGVLSALQDVGWRPSDTWLRLWSEVSSRALAGMTLNQLAAAAGALAGTGYTPGPWWARRLAAAARPLLPTAGADALLLLLHSLASLRAGAPDPGWVHEAYGHLAQQRGALSLRQLADAAHVLGSLRPLPPALLATHRAWLAGCLAAVGAWQQGSGGAAGDDAAAGAAAQRASAVATSAASALSRQELLYLLYAAARLHLAPGPALLAAALGRLQRELPLCGPAQLGGCLTVFCYWYKREQQQQQQQQQQQGAAGTAPAGAPGMPGALLPPPSSRSGGGAVANLQQVHDCLLAVCACAAQFSDEGLLQLLLTCAGAGLPPSPSPEQGGRSEQGAASMQGCIDGLSALLVSRLRRMSLTQLSHVKRALQGRSATAAGLGWYGALLAQASAALAARV